jgi:hypothetical protein
VILGCRREQCHIIQCALVWQHLHDAGEGADMLCPAESVGGGVLCGEACKTLESLGISRAEGVALHITGVSHALLDVVDGDWHLGKVCV